MRKNSRIAVYKILFSKVFNNEPCEGFDELVFEEEKLDEKDIAFARELLNAFNAHEEIINAVIAKYAQGYSFKRLFATDKCAMQICVTEMLYFENIPHIVSISEAMDLVRTYSAEESPNFVNGILAQIKKSIEAGEVTGEAPASAAAPEPAAEAVVAAEAANDAFETADVKEN